jgi:hypothetical protein
MSAERRSDALGESPRSRACPPAPRRPRGRPMSSMPCGSACSRTVLVPRRATAPHVRGASSAGRGAPAGARRPAPGPRKPPPGPERGAPPGRPPRSAPGPERLGAPPGRPPRSAPGPERLGAPPGRLLPGVEPIASALGPRWGVLRGRPHRAVCATALRPGGCTATIRQGSAVAINAAGNRPARPAHRPRRAEATGCGAGGGAPTARPRRPSTCGTATRRWPGRCTATTRTGLAILPALGGTRRAHRGPTLGSQTASSCGGALVVGPLARTRRGCASTHAGRTRGSTRRTAPPTGRAATAGRHPSGAARRVAPRRSRALGRARRRRGTLLHPPSLATLGLAQHVVLARAVVPRNLTCGSIQSNCTEHRPPTQQRPGSKTTSGPTEVEPLA